MFILEGQCLITGDRELIEYTKDVKKSLHIYMRGTLKVWLKESSWVDLHIWAQPLL